jgi:hypothetical protein
VICWSDVQKVVYVTAAFPSKFLARHNFLDLNYMCVCVRARARARVCVCSNDNS